MAKQNESLLETCGEILTQLNTKHKGFLSVGKTDKKPIFYVGKTDTKFREKRTRFQIKVAISRT